jgi:hypothetical protein
MVDLTEAQIAAAEERGRMIRASVPHAASARYDPDSERMIVDLDNGATFAFPPRLVQGLETATPDELAAVELLGDGFGLHWERLDVDFTVGGLLNGIFGTARWMAEKAGRTSSPAKAAAARVNGAKGGRPRKAG